MRATLNVTRRAALTKGQVRRLRADGQVPVTLSTRGADTLHLVAPARELQDILHGHGQATLISLKGLDDPDVVAIARDIQRSPVGHRLLHVGFRRVSGQDRVTAQVPVVLHGEPEVVRTGIGVLEQQSDTLEVRSTADRLPGHIDVDVSGLEIGGVVRVADLPPHPDYEVHSSADTVIASVHTVRAAVTPEEEAQVTEEEAGTQAGQAATE